MGIVHENALWYGREVDDGNFFGENAAGGLSVPRKTWYNRNMPQI
jgi:hypothetical protein